MYVGSNNESRGIKRKQMEDERNEGNVQVAMIVGVQQGYNSARWQAVCWATSSATTVTNTASKVEWW